MESDVPPASMPSLIPGLVANRMLEEDSPRYTRASDPREPCVMGKHGTTVRIMHTAHWHVASMVTVEQQHVVVYYSALVVQ